MKRLAPKIIAAALPTTLCAAASASVTVCETAAGLKRTYTVAGDHGVYTWDDHGIERTWTLTCNEQRDGVTACHRWEQYGENGRSVMIFRMLPDGTLIEAASLALLDISTVRVTPGFVCATEGE